MSYHTNPAPGSLDQSPPGKAIPPSALDDLEIARDAARAVSVKLRKGFETLDAKVNPVVPPNQEKPDPGFDESLALADLGMKLASQETKELELEKAIVAAERDEGKIKPRVAKRNIDTLQDRIFSAGEDLWKYSNKKVQLQDAAGSSQISGQRRGVIFSYCLSALYKKCDGQDKRRDKKKRPNNSRRNMVQWYDGDSEANGQEPDQAWCHALGMWQMKDHHKAAHIVPFFLESEALTEMLFGSRAPEVDREANGLLLTYKIEQWFGTYHLVIVPADLTETRLRGWRIELIDESISKTRCDQRGYTGADLHERELAFRNDNRPAARFLYFHFLMALVRIKDLKRPKWRSVWARYHNYRPFPTPGNYIRQSMLVALAKHANTTDLDTIGSWISENGFDTQL
ncbi:hypothetical protein N3K66_003659 [Trichothecium roseum]|uniref:Uncharacterized protein n=1 Tax=Trichothecium roseum TaxID=47278 RepID=A0ACC0V6S2_9HYPO|nr:hypothetical protein N3K66_003659 [Trichothecium roseum]